MAKLLKLSDVKVGTIIKYEGTNWEVNNKVGDAIGIKRGQLSKTVLGANTLLTVIAEPAPESSLTQQLQQQVKKQSLTESLRHQVDAQEDEDDFEDDDLDDEDEWEEEEEESIPVFGRYASEETIDAQARFNAHIASGKAYQASKLARLGDLRAQHALNQAECLKGHVNAELNNVYAEIDAVASNLGEDIAHLAANQADFVYQVDDAIEDVVEQANEALAWVQDDIESIDTRVSKLEQKERAKLKNELQAQLNAKLQNKSDNKGGVNVKNVLGKFKGLFGKVEGQFALGLNGAIAMRKGLKNEYVAYDKKSGVITDMDSMVLEFDVPAFRLPVESKDIKIGNIVVNEGNYGYVTEVVENGEYVKVIYPTKASQGTVLPVTNFVFGKPFFTVVQTFDMATEQGGFNPMLLMALKDGKKDDLLPFLLMSGGLGGQAQAGAIDPTMLMLLGDNTDELLPFLLMQQGGITEGGFNPLMLLLAGDKGGSKKDSLLPLLMMQQGGQAGGFNPMMFALLGDGDLDLTTLALMGGLGGQQGANPLGNIFGSVQAPKGKKEDK